MREDTASQVSPVARVLAGRRGSLVSVAVPLVIGALAAWIPVAAVSGSGREIAARAFMVFVMVAILAGVVMASVRAWALSSARERTEAADAGKDRFRRTRAPVAT